MNSCQLVRKRKDVWLCTFHGATENKTSGDNRRLSFDHARSDRLAIPKIEEVDMS